MLCVFHNETYYCRSSRLDLLPQSDTLQQIFVLRVNHCSTYSTVGATRLQLIFVAPVVCAMYQKTLVRFSYK